MAYLLKSAWGVILSALPGSKSNIAEKKQPAKTSPLVNLQPNDNISEGQECIQRLADAVKEKSSLLEPQTGPLPVYKIPLNEEQINLTGCRRFSLGKDSNKPNRTIMVLGATGAGKSTLINGMINYILDVEWKDSFRFKLVNEDQSKSQAESQTTEVTVYKINHQEGFKIEYSLTIVDTPGFGDTRGIERDKEITEQLRNLFSAKLGVSEIDAVCFVAQASLARLTPSQKYVFDSVLSIFGKDVAENIRVLVTFADGQRPPVLEAINAAGVPCPKTKDGLPVHFKFNNSALFADNKSSAADSMSEDEEDGGFDQMFWKMGTKSMKRFFAALNVIETKSLTMTKEVLRERKQLENSVENLQKQVKFGLAKLEEINETSQKLKEHEAEISRNENFEFEVTVTKPVQIDISGKGNFLTNCQQCHNTCHHPCGIPSDADKRGCVAMGSNGHCTVCPGKCYWNEHFNQKYKWDYKEVKEKRTVKELKEKYLKAADAKRPVQTLIGKLKAEYDEVQTEVNKLIACSAQCLNKLKEIALKPNPLSTPEYIDMIIEGEKSECKPGWKERVQSLIAMREKAECMAKVDRGEKLLQSPSTDLQHCNQGQTKNKAETDTNQNKAKPNSDIDKYPTEAGTNQNQDESNINQDQDSKLHTNIDQEQDKTDSESDQGQDSKLYTNPDEDHNKTDSDSDKD
uniref:Septin-type G domain-containing protein n=1 Tax=Dicentrarchus labrax TaxID=13489 RepID=A0A8C4DYF0_DICLA